MPDGSKLRGNIYEWPVLRNDREFRTFVVEPAELAPACHTQIFNGALSSLLSPPPLPFNPHGTNVSLAPIPFDLLTFPEAFLPADELVASLTDLSTLGEPLGCVHVGLRPDTDKDHLFTIEQLHVLVDALSSVPTLVAADLAPFTKWVDQQQGGRFNIACLFAIDADSRLRVCLHPKMVRSKFEAQAQPEADMTEAHLLSLVTLVPRDPNFLTITLQPLICSDVLMLDTGNGVRPIPAVSDRAEYFEVRPPDHIDLVSVATCTPQQVLTGLAAVGSGRRWQEAFRNAFTNAITHQRHTKAAFVMANFLTVLGGAAGGLSGVYLPIKLSLGETLTWAELHQHGYDVHNPDNQWLPLGHGKPEDKRQARANLVQLKAYEGETAPHRMFGFIIERLPRHFLPWSSTQMLRNVTLRHGKLDDLTAQVVFTQVPA